MEKAASGRPSLFVGRFWPFSDRKLFCWPQTGGKHDDGTE
jgi:hypothetical protein